MVIAPGLNSNFQAFTYIVNHLASYGFAIAGIDFPESDAARMQDSLQGLDAFPNPNAWLEQPRDITLVLDTLAPAPPIPPADLVLECDEDIPPPVNLTATGLRPALKYGRRGMGLPLKTCRKSRMM